MDDIVLRDANGVDLPAASALLTLCKLALSRVGRQFGPNFVVATAGSQLVGLAGVERYGSDGLFRSAAVHPDWRAIGLGRRVTENRISWARGEGIGCLFLLTETAEAYWPRFGFEPIERDGAPADVMASEEWAHGCPASAVAMRLDLAA